MAAPPLVLLLQLPIPPPGPMPVEGNVPLAAGYLKLFARRQGLEDRCRIELLPAAEANTLGDAGLVQAILERRPWLVGFTCYGWNIERTLWIAQQLKESQPALQVVLGGPEITPDNRWVREHPAADFAVFGEGEQTFAELLASLLDRDVPDRAPWGRLPTCLKSRQVGNLPHVVPPIPGLGLRGQDYEPPCRRPLAELDAISSPYLAEILDAADGEAMLLETARGCRYRCKFCYYPKSYDRQYFLSPQQVRACLAHAAARGVREVFLLDPTLNQRPKFADFLRLLAAGNPQRQFSYSAELRAEGIRPDTARLLAEANFAEVEVGLQSVDARAQALMDRRVPPAAFERGVRAMLDEGIQVKVDLIVGLPGDTAESVRRGLDFLQHSGAYSQVQVFYLSVLPGTAFRAEAAGLGLRYQPRPPYHVLGTPTLSLEEMVDLAEEAEERFGVEFDPLPEPALPVVDLSSRPVRAVRIDLDRPPWKLPPPADRAQCFSLWLCSRDFLARQADAARLVGQLLADCPHTTLEVLLEPLGPPDRVPEALPAIHRACFQSVSYLDRYYSLSTQARGAKRIVLLLPEPERARLGPEWLAAADPYAAILWRGEGLP